MEDTKSKWQSVGFWSGLATIAGSLAGLIGVQLDVDLLNQMIVSSFTLVSGAINLWGRLRAKTRLT